MIKKKIQFIIEADITISDEAQALVAKEVESEDYLRVLEHVIEGIASTITVSDEGVVVDGSELTDWECWNA